MGYNRTDFKLSFDHDETKFFVNEEKGTVVCLVRGLLKVPVDWDKHFFVEPCVIVERGTAKCSGEDVFDVERGKRIALAKAENKAYITALRHLETYYNEMSFLMTAMEEFEDKTYRCCAHNEDFIESLSYEAHPNYKKELTPLKQKQE